VIKWGVEGKSYFMKKLDKLILKSFLGPFLLTFVVVVFILLSQTMIKYFDDFAGKGLGLEVFAELIFYFSIFTTPVALPLAVLLSCLMTFGNLGEHSELTAIKGSGISLLRTLAPIFIITIFFTFLAYFNNNYIVPKANLKAYSLLYDIKMKKPALDLKEGAFYNGIRGLSIKVNKKDGNGNLEEVIIYDHREGQGNSNVILAESGKMYTILNERYLILELFSGRIYSQLIDQSRYRSIAYNEVQPYKEDRFDSSKLVLSLAEFEFTRTDEDLFRSNRLMLNVHELRHYVDSLRREIVLEKFNTYHSLGGHLPRHIKDKVEIPVKLAEEKRKIDSIRAEYFRRLNEQEHEASRELENEEIKEGVEEEVKRRRGLFARNRKVPEEKKPDASIFGAPSHELMAYQNRMYNAPYFGVGFESNIDEARKIDSLVALLPEDTLKLTYDRFDSAMQAMNSKEIIIREAIDRARSAKNQINMDAERMFNGIHNLRKYEIEKHKKFAQAFACLVMFLVGAPLGSIIKKGGLGIPVILSIMFFIIYYVFSMTGEKWARHDLITPFWGVWNSNFVLLPLGLFFLKQARIDARLFDADYYHVVISKIKAKINSKRKIRQ
jgi:lipopolysaccharide export system permease protein